jgi:hypothetical protein
MLSAVAPEFWFLASPITALVVMLSAQTVLLRLAGGEHFFRSVVVGFLAGFAVNIVLQGALLLVFPATFDRWVLAVMVNVPLYVCLAYCYYNFINLGQCSIRIRVYKECADRGGFITPEQLRSVYDEDGIREARIERLLHGGDLVLRDGTYHLASRRLVPIAAIVFGLKRIVLRRESEFDHPL